MSISDFNMYNLPGAAALIFIAAGMFWQHKNIVFEDRKLNADDFRLWSEIILIAAYVLILPTAAEQFTEPLRTPDGIIEACMTALAAFILSFSSLLRFLKNKKKLQNEKQKESL